MTKYKIFALLVSANLAQDQTINVPLYRGILHHVNFREVIYFNSKGSLFVESTLSSLHDGLFSFGLKMMWT